MSKRKPLDKAEARERRNRMLESAAAAKLSLTEGVREMRAVAGMTQEEFARHRGVSARVIKAIELGQGNPTVATMNRIGQFFGLEVAFVPIKRVLHAADQPQPVDGRMSTKINDVDISPSLRKVIEKREEIDANMRILDKMISELDVQLDMVRQRHKTRKSTTGSSLASTQVKHPAPADTAAGEARARTKRKPRSS
jgi:DNA-binding XRE family transcriptional regulator